MCTSSTAAAAVTSVARSSSSRADEQNTMSGRTRLPPARNVSVAGPDTCGAWPPANNPSISSHWVSQGRRGRTKA